MNEPVTDRERGREIIPNSTSNIKSASDHFVVV